ncbi:BRCA1 BRCA2-containing complex, subunit 3 [Clydaea vesicula]|uniref:BRCA1 BRCA2-containing complex, subunit 3 n=1 Tax=Clydaea vesicula TaxID=447962 RepID=A0AAD5XVD5_9FUNG|nr:BRCA1 BRCA2-containing complex, subunit 3 [Clydaea vesicula]
MKVLSSVFITSNAFNLILAHSLTTDNEEVCSLLLGFFKTQQHSINAFVTNIQFVVRRDKRRDRVEIEPEQLSLAIENAESKGLKVIGCHVDVGTQNSLQQLDLNFFGLILSCFDKNVNRLQLTCFQAQKDANEHVKSLEIPVFILPSLNKHDLIDHFDGCDLPDQQDTFTELGERLVSVLMEEEKLNFEKFVNKNDNQELINIEKLNENTNNYLETSYHSLLYLMSLTNILDKICLPIEHLFKERLERNLREIKELEECDSISKAKKNKDSVDLISFEDDDEVEVIPQSPNLFES